MAVKMEVFNEGVIVKYKSLSVGVILSIFKPIGTYKSYTVLLFDNQKTVTASRVNLEHYMSMEEQVEICSEEVDFREILMTEQQPKSRFADSSEEVIEKVRSEKTSAGTKKQTVWEVTILRGKKRQVF